MSKTPQRARRPRLEPTGIHLSRGALLLARIVDTAYQSMAEAALAIGCSKGTLSEILSGQRRPNLTLVQSIAALHGRRCPLVSWSQVAS